ncbi:MAG: TolC family protein [Planctomycetaceae bacterium]
MRWSCRWFEGLSLPAVAALFLGVLGCATPAPRQAPPPPRINRTVAAVAPAAPVRLTSHLQAEAATDADPTTTEAASETLIDGFSQTSDPLATLEATAVENNPVLRRMQQEAAAQWAKTGYVSRLPDPSIGGMVFTPPMMLDPDRQRAELQVTQMIPWLGRLEAEAQRAHLEALAADNSYHAERLRVIGDLRVAWFRLYVLTKQIETAQSDQAQLETLITTANARVATGNAQPGDVLMATLELSALQEKLIAYRQQLVGTTAELNRLAGRDSSSPISPPARIDPRLPDWDHEMLRQIAMQSQPEMDAARLRTAATRWGIEVARLKRRPDLTFGAGWIVMDAPGATDPQAGSDSFTLGVTATAPIWRRKYDAICAEAAHEHAAAHASEEDVALRIDATLHDLWAQARASQQTIELYQSSILPQARQVFEADQQSLVNNTVTFERLIGDYRTLINLELGYHQALGQLATTLVRIQQTIGTDLAAVSERGEP